ncbi:MAG: histidine kinase [Ruminococcus sp.]|jgi:two-component system sensor histidine kinase YesM|nr:histidine kinase [Ruminococcus sp.]
MRKKMPLRLLFVFLSVALIPVLFFSAAMQLYTVKIEKKDMEKRVEGNLNTSNQGLEMVFEKYTTILYDLCTDKEILNIVERIEAAGDEEDENTRMLQYRLEAICSRYEGLEGIMISLTDGGTVFYDSLSSSSVSSPWIERQEIPEVKKGNVYRGISEPVIDNEKRVYMFQITGHLERSGLKGESRATAAVYINEEQICKVLNGSGYRQGYLLDGERILSSASKADIGRNCRELMNLEENHYACILNNISGFTICNIQPVKAYKDLLQIQYLMLGIIVLVSAFVVSIMAYLIKKPYQKVVNDYVDAMNRVGRGDFTIQTTEKTRIIPDMGRIEKEFNRMVLHIRKQVELGERASEEQKRAQANTLEAQIAPHFLYNALDMINWKAIENEQYEISEMLGMLGDILRYSVKNIDDMTTLRTEFQWLEHYVWLGNVELSRKTKLKLQVPEELMELQIHKLLLQPFIENALKYAFLNRGGDDILMVGVGLAGSQIHITIEDNGRGIDEGLLRKLNDETADMGEHVGISNVRKRLKLYYGEDAVVYFESLLDCYTRIHLFIPVRTEMQSNG